MEHEEIFRQRTRRINAPIHSVPLEIFLTILSPNWRNTRTAGIGTTTKITNPITSRLFLDLVTTTILCARRAPYHFHLSQGFELDKANEKRNRRNKADTPLLRSMQRLLPNNMDAMPLPLFTTDVPHIEGEKEP